MIYLFRKIIDLIFYLIKSIFQLLFRGIAGTGRTGLWIIRLLIPFVIIAGFRLYGYDIIKYLGANKDKILTPEVKSKIAGTVKEVQEISKPGMEKLGDLLPKEEDFIKASVESVIDGDTLKVKKSSGESVTIRLIGVDTPESKHKKTEKNTKAGETAFLETQKLFPVGKEVFLEYDLQEKDKYQRDLAYVYLDLPEGRRMYNEVLLEKGMARLLTIPPNVKYQDRFVSIQEIAQKNGIGFWKTPEEAWK